MQYALRLSAFRHFGVRHLTQSHAKPPTFWPDRRIRHETLPEEQLRREEHKTYRVRKHGNAELPLPPLLDPAVHRSRMRYARLEQRLQKDVPMTTFQKELASNPYGTIPSSPLEYD